MKNLVIFPAYSKANNIASLIPKILEQDVRLLFINDNSEDSTVKIKTRT